MSKLKGEFQLKVKTERLEKLRKEKELRDSNKVKEKETIVISPEQEAIEQLLAKARMYEEEMKEKQRQEIIKKKLEDKKYASNKKKLINTTASAVNEITIPSKPKLTKRDFSTQIGEEKVVEVKPKVEEHKNTLNDQPITVFI